MRWYTVILASLVMVMTFCVQAAELTPQTAQDFTLKSLSGENLRLREQIGEVILLNFWASWCGPCREEMPELEKLQQKYQSLGFKVIGVNVENAAEKATGFLKNTPVTFPIVVDADSTVSKLYHVEAMPTTYLIDRQGQLRFLHKGYQKGTAAEYETQIKQLIRE